MTALRWGNGQGEAEASGESWRLGMKPLFAFAFDAIDYAGGAGTVTVGDVTRALNAEELSILAAYLGDVPTAGASLVHGVDAAGEYLGLVDRAQAAAIATSAPPAAGEWKWQGNAWARHYTRAEREAMAWEAIKAERDRRKSAGFVVDGIGFHSDDASRIQYLGLKTNGVPAGTKWKTLGGVFVDMDAAKVDQVLTAGAAYEKALFTAAEIHAAQMRASADPLAYDFGGGWPAGYVGP